MGEIIQIDSCISNLVESALGLKHRDAEERARLYMSHRIPLDLYLSTLQAVRRYTFAVCRSSGMPKGQAEIFFFNFLNRFCILPSKICPPSPFPYQRIVGFYKETKAMHQESLPFLPNTREEALLYLEGHREAAIITHKEKEDILWRSGKEKNGQILFLRNVSEQEQSSKKEKQQY